MKTKRTHLLFILLALLTFIPIVPLNAQDSLIQNKPEPKLEIVHNEGILLTRRLDKNDFLQVYITGEEIPIKGKYTEITDSTITVDEHVIPYSTIEAIRLTRRGLLGVATFFLLKGLAGVGLGLVVMINTADLDSFGTLVFFILGGVTVASEVVASAISAVLLTRATRKYYFDRWHFSVE